ncbi:MAG: sulfatase-like hydrolase/transferase [Bacteroidota bacterium]
MARKSGKSARSGSRGSSGKGFRKWFRTYKGNIHVVLFLRLLTVTVFLFLSRAVFYVFNLKYFSNVPSSEELMIFYHGLRFDLAAILMVNLPFIAMYLLPFKFREKKGYLLIADIYFYLANITALLANFVDIIYFRFTLKRITADIFLYLQVGGDFDKLLPQFLKDFWYILIAFIVYILLMVLTASRFRVGSTGQKIKGGNFSYYLVNILMALIFAGFSVIGIRGGLQLRPINVVTAAMYTTARNVPLVLNTPFSILRTWNNEKLNSLRWYKTEADLDKVYNPVHQGKQGNFKRMNVMIIIMESFSREHIGLLNRDLDNGRYQGFTPFMDSLIRHSLYFDAYANGKTSIQGIPAVLSSIPSLMYESFIQTSYASGKFTSIGGLLKAKGYSTAFFHGGSNGTMGFDSYTHYVGFDKYFGRNEYHNEADYDGKWGIRDEQFFQYAAKEITAMGQPFCAAFFSLSSHHPYFVPPKYINMLRTGNLPIQQSIMYADLSLAGFFHSIQHLPWYKNTLFVITADHTSEAYYPYYQSNAGQYAIPLLFYRPGDEIKGMSKITAQQTDIMPTVLSYLGYEGKYLAFGTNLMDTLTPHFSVHYSSGVFGMMKDNYLLEFDGSRSTHLFNLPRDPMQRTNLLNTEKTEKERLVMFMKAFLQQYNNRLIENRLIVE